MSSLRNSQLTPPAARPALARIDPLIHGGPGEETGFRVIRADFSTGVNAFGPAPVVMDALRNADPAAYPDPQCRLARDAASRWTGRPADEVLIGAGTVELIYAATQAFVRPGDLVLVVEPAFGEYRRAARLAGAKVCASHFAGGSARRHGAVEDFCQTLLRHRPRMAFVGSPESATGAALEPELLTRMADVCQLVGTLLVLDQAYDAFTRRPLGTPALPGHAAVLHLRSLTKDHALAGVRVGLAVGPGTVIEAVARVRPPWTASSLAQAAVIAACAEPAQRHVQATTASLIEEASRLAAVCAGAGIRPLPSATHYFLLEVGDGDRVARALLHDHALRVRSAVSFGFPSCIRVAARRPEENALLVPALRKIASLPATENHRVEPH